MHKLVVNIMPTPQRKKQNMMSTTNLENTVRRFKGSFIVSDGVVHCLLADLIVLK